MKMTTYWTQNKAIKRPNSSTGSKFLLLYEKYTQRGTNKDRQKNASGDIYRKLVHFQSFSRATEFYMSPNISFYSLWPLQEGVSLISTPLSGTLAYFPVFFLHLRLSSPAAAKQSPFPLSLTCNSFRAGLSPSILDISPPKMRGENYKSTHLLNR